MIHADLPNTDLIVGARFKDSPGQADVIVKVAFGFGDAKFSRQNRGGKIFRGCLAVAAGNGENPKRQRFAIICGQSLIGAQSIFDSNQDRVFCNSAGPITIDHHSRGPALHHSIDEVVSVEILTAQCDKQFTAFQGP